MEQCNPDETYRVTIKDKSSTISALIAAMKSLSKGIEADANVMYVDTLRSADKIEGKTKCINLLCELVVGLAYAQSEKERKKAEEEK